MTPRRFAILDRDGTVLVERNYLSDPDEVALLPGCAAGLRRMRELGLGLIMVTNQSGLARGYFDQSTLTAVETRMAELLAEEHVVLDAIFCCPHHPDQGCDCRKPLPGLVCQAAARFAFDPRNCFIIGDKPCDIELGQAVGARTILVRTGYGAEYEALGTVHPDWVADNLPAAAEIIARHLALQSPGA